MTIIRQRTTASRRARTAAAGALALIATALTVTALGTGRSFLFLDAGHQQELFGVTQLGDDGNGGALSLGGVAFAPDGDVWAAECLYFSTRLHRFDADSTAPLVNGTSTLHPETIIGSPGMCGLTNHPDGFIYANSDRGVYRLDPSTGSPVLWPGDWSNPRGWEGNSLGITVDPRTGRVVYSGADCNPSYNPADPTCTIHEVDPVTGEYSVFATLTGSQAFFADTIHFDPSGDYLLAASRSEDGTTSAITVLRRPEDSTPNTALPQVAQTIPTARKAGGFAFHASSPRFLVTSDEDGGTMTKYTFAGDDYATTPTASAFANGGFRGSFMSVGLDGCIYTTQGRRALATDTGTRYDDQTGTSEDSIVRICGGFAPSPGVTETVTGGSCEAGIGNLVWLDSNANGIQDAGEPGIAGVTVTLKASDGSVVAAATTDAGGSYQLTAACGGTYTVEVATPLGHAPTTSGSGTPATDSDAAPASVTLAAGGAGDDSIDFGFVLGGVSGTAFSDANRNGVRDAGEPGLTGVSLTMSGPSALATTTGTGGTYSFSGLLAGSYSVSAPTEFSGLARTTSSPRAANVPAGQQVAGVDFGYAPGSISGFAFVDDDSNGVRDAGEQGLGNVNVSLTGAASNSTMTATGGDYGFGGLSAGAYSVTAPQTVSGMTRASSPHQVNLAAGESHSAADFAYRRPVTPEPPPTPDPKPEPGAPKRVVRMHDRHDMGWLPRLTDAQHWVTIANGKPGMDGIDVWVNGRLFRARQLRDGETRVIDVRSAMHRGRHNMMLLVSHGSRRDTAVVTIAGVK